MKCTNALSEWMINYSKRDGGIYQQEYKRGIPVAPVKKVGNAQTMKQVEHRFLLIRDIYRN
jgi:DNA gyrase/topoisomerase IV subunit B